MVLLYPGFPKPIIKNFSKFTDIICIIYENYVIIYLRPNGEMVDAIDSKSIMVTCKSSSLFWGSKY